MKTLTKLVTAAILFAGMQLALSSSATALPANPRLSGKAFALSGNPIDVAVTEAGVAWVSLTGGPNAVARINLAGKVKDFASNIVADNATGVNSIVIGSTGAVWLVSNPGTPGAKGFGIARILPNGNARHFDTDIPSCCGTFIGGLGTGGKDGRIWFGASFGRAGRMTNTGDTLEPLGAAEGFPEGQAAYGWATDGRGRMWFTFLKGIGRVDSPSKISAFTKGFLDGASVNDITLGPDGNLWFTDRLNGIGRITPKGAVKMYPVNGGPCSITSAAGALWFTNLYTGTIGRITVAGKVTQFDVPVPPSTFQGGIAAGPNKTLWYVTDQQRVVRVKLP